MNASVNSKIFIGNIKHRRLKPKPHQLNYKLFMMYIDLDELPYLFDGFWLWSKDKFNIACFRTSDYLHNKNGNIKDTVIDEIDRRYQTKVTGPIRMLTHLRYFGHCFNPVTFYYCFDSLGENIDFILAQVNNTPWDERHIYTIDNRNKKLQKQNSRFINDNFDKEFHVSPFLPPDMQCHWRFSTVEHNLSVFIQNHIKGKKVFDASLYLTAKKINSKNLNLALLKFPMMTIKVVWGIYWNALKLWVKGTPFYSHPKDTTQKI